MLRPGSITRNEKCFTRIDRVDARQERLEFCRQYFPSLEVLALNDLLNTCYGLFMDLSTTHRRFDPSGAIRRDLHRRFFSADWRRFVRERSFRTRIRFLLFRFCPGLLVRLMPVYVSVMSRLRTVR